MEPPSPLDELARADLAAQALDAHLEVPGEAELKALFRLIRVFLGLM